MSAQAALNKRHIALPSSTLALVLVLVLAFRRIAGSGMAAVAAANMVMIAYAVMAMREDTGQERSQNTGARHKTD